MTSPIFIYGPTNTIVGLSFAPNVKVNCQSIEANPLSEADAYGAVTLDVSAVFTVSQAVTAVHKTTICEYCESVMPPPTSPDQLLYLLKHGSKDLLFPGPQELYARPEAGRFPAADGWRLNSHGATCPDCSKEVAKALSDLRAKKRLETKPKKEENNE